MPDIDTSTHGLWWLQPGGWIDQGRNDLLEGMRLRQQESQFKRQQVMDLLNYNLREKEANVRMQTQIMEQKEYHDFLDDVPKLSAFAANPDQEMPKFTSAKGFAAAEQIQRNSNRTKATQEGIKRLSDAEGDILQYGDEDAISKVLAARSNPQMWGEAIAHYAPLARKTKLEEQERLIKARGGGQPIAQKYFTLADNEQALADEFRAQGDEANAKLHDERAKSYRDLTAPKAPAEPVGKKYMDLADKEEADAEAARTKSDTAGYQMHKERADNYRQLAAPKSSTIDVTTGPEGTKVTQTTGPKPTTAMTTRAQEQTAKYEDALVLMNRLTKNLNPTDVGPQGVVGEWVLDKTLPALGQSQFYSGARVTNRVALGTLRETLLRAMNEDPSRFSVTDRREISELLPSSGVFESYPDALDKMGEVKRILVDRIRNYSERTKIPLSDAVKTPQEIATEYESGKKQLAQAVQDGKLTKEQAQAQLKALYDKAQDALTRFH